MVGKLPATENCIKFISEASLILWGYFRLLNTMECGYSVDTH